MSQQRRILFTNNAKFAVANDRTVSGYAMVWGATSSDRGGYFVRLKPGSAKFTTPTQALFHHQGQAVIGTTANGTLRISPDDYGVKVEIDLPKTSVGNDVLELVGQKYIDGMSFSMAEPPTGKVVKENGCDVFEADSFLCDEVTVTGSPAFTETTIGLKSDDPSFAARAIDELRFQEFRFSMLR